jgi:hypothetical protein
MEKGLPLMTDNQQWLCHSSLFQPEDEHMMLSPKDTSAGRQGGRNGFRVRWL